MLQLIIVPPTFSPSVSTTKQPHDRRLPPSTTRLAVTATRCAAIVAFALCRAIDNLPHADCTFDASKIFRDRRHDTRRDAQKSTMTTLVALAPLLPSLRRAHLGHCRRRAQKTFVRCGGWWRRRAAAAAEGGEGGAGSRRRAGDRESQLHRLAGGSSSLLLGPSPPRRRSSKRREARLILFAQNSATLIVVARRRWPLLLVAVDASCKKSALKIGARSPLFALDRGHANDRRPARRAD